jgi:hypothetical protein
MTLRAFLDGREEGGFNPIVSSWDLPSEDAQMRQAPLPPSPQFGNCPVCPNFCSQPWKALSGGFGR